MRRRRPRAAAACHARPISIIAVGAVAVQKHDQLARRTSGLRAADRQAQPFALRSVGVAGSGRRHAAWSRDSRTTAWRPRLATAAAGERPHLLRGRAGVEFEQQRAALVERGRWRAVAMAGRTADRCRRSRADAVHRGQRRMGFVGRLTRRGRSSRAIDRFRDRLHADSDADRPARELADVRAAPPHDRTDRRQGEPAQIAFAGGRKRCETTIEASPRSVGTAPQRGPSGATARC